MVLKKRSSFATAAVWFFVSIILVRNIAGQGFIIPRPIPHLQPATLNLTHHNVTVKITDQVAAVTVDQVFFNDSQQAIEGVYYFPLPENASISEFNMVADGKLMTGEILDKGKAREIYEQIVRRNLDPALLEYVNQNLFSAAIFPIPPHKERKIVLRYSALLPMDGDMVKFSYPLRGDVQAGRGARPDLPLPQPMPMEKNSFRANEPGIQQLIAIDIQSQIPLKTVYSPSHDVSISRMSDHRASVSYEGKREPNRENFVLYYSYSRQDFGMNIMTYQSPDDEGNFFMLLVSPRTDFSDQEILNKDILFVLDVSGSMSGEKISQAQDALTYCINRLGQNDRFNIITFSTETTLFRDALVLAAEHRNDALQFVRQMGAQGGTNIGDALARALTFRFDAERAGSIVFLTDGLPTVGETDITAILKQTSERNTSHIKIFTFGVGYDVNTVLLDKIALNSRAVSDYIEPGEQIEQKIAAFYDKISHPVLADLDIDFGRMSVENVFPKKLPDLFKGSQLTILGTYKNKAATEVTLTGRAGDRERKFTYPVNPGEKGEGHEFLPHLWATRKIGYLMDEIRLHGENEELKNEVIRLSKKYGVMSPYTSYLVQEDEVMAKSGQAVPGGIGAGNGASDRKMASERLSVSSAPAPAAYDQGMLAVKLSKETQRMKEANAIEDNVAVRRVAGRTFYLKENVWVDSEYADQKTVDVKFGSEAFQQILIKQPSLAKILALGDKVIFKWKKNYIRIWDTGAEDITAAGLREFFK
ncbi:MAG: VIT domain-containing protein [Candidatus Zhuqueibacterota bacterium]